MCHALPVKIIALTGVDTAKVSLGGIVKEISVALIEEPKVGDYVVLHVGYALAKIDEKEAEHTLALLAAEGSEALTEFSTVSEVIEAPP
jgi:hydrogenase expression/formation protein HypC